MLSGLPLVLLLLAAVAFIVVATSVFDLHPFPTLLVAAYATGLVAGIDPAEVANVVTTGFGDILAGTIIGTTLEKSGGAIVIAESILGVVGVVF